MRRATRLLSVLLSTALVCSLAAWGYSTAAQRPERAESLNVEARLRRLGLELPPTSQPVAVYKSIVVSDKMVYLAGHIPRDEAGKVMQGKVGQTVDIDEANAAARRAALALLATTRAKLGTLNRVRRVVKITGMVNATPDFQQHPEVINGCSQVFADVFGPDRGVGARAAVGMSSLPRGAIVEIEAILELW